MQSRSLFEEACKQNAAHIFLEVNIIFSGSVFDNYKSSKLKTKDMKKLMICAVIALGFIGCNSSADSSTTSTDTTMTTDGSSTLMGADTMTDAEAGNNNSMGGINSGSSGSIDTSRIQSGGNASGSGSPTGGAAGNTTGVGSSDTGTRNR